jgi:hypothetical protein
MVERDPSKFDTGNRSIPLSRFGPVAQWVEHRSLISVGRWFDPNPELGLILPWIPPSGNCHLFFEFLNALCRAFFVVQVTRCEAHEILFHRVMGVSSHVG